MSFLSAIGAGIGLKLGAFLFDFGIFLIIMLVFYLVIAYLNRR